MKRQKGRGLDILYCLIVIVAIVVIAWTRHRDIPVSDYRDYIATDTTRYHYSDSVPSPAAATQASKPKKQKQRKDAAVRQHTAAPVKRRDALSELIPRTDTIACKTIR